MTLLADVVRLLEAQGIRHAVIGAAAMAVHGVSRSTLDIDLLTTDPRALARDTYRIGLEHASVAVHAGAADDPLAGIVRVRRDTERDVDIVIGRAAWQNSCVERAEARDIDGIAVPVVNAADVILLKLYAAGSQDAWDIEQLLATETLPNLSEIDHRIKALPAPSRELWQRLRTRRAR